MGRTKQTEKKTPMLIVEGFASIMEAAKNKAPAMSVNDSEASGSASTASASASLTEVGSSQAGTKSAAKNKALALPMNDSEASSSTASAPAAAPASTQVAKPAQSEATMRIEAFKATVRIIRDMLRSHGITGKDSFIHLSLLLCARFFTRDLAQRLGVDPKYSWDGIMDVYRDETGEWARKDCRDQLIVERFTDGILLAFDTHLKTSNFRFEFRNSRDFVRAVELLNPIDFSKLAHDLDILGYLWELHLESGMSKARDLGQFFTDRRVALYLTELCAPGFVDLGGGARRPEYICDPSMGTGGFLTNAVRYYRARGFEDWVHHTNAIQGCDIDSTIAAIARISLLLDTGCLFPDLRTQDSLKNGLPLDAYEVILANMPFGLKNLTHAACCDRIKDLHINGTKSEPLFMQLIMQSMARGGRCAVVVPDGFLGATASIHIKTREHLLRKFKVERIIAIKGKIFMGTGVQTSVLFFRRPLEDLDGNAFATIGVEFWEIEKDGENIRESHVQTIPIETVEANQWSLDRGMYKERNGPVPGQDKYPVRTLEEICTHQTGKNIPKEKRLTEGYPYYGSNGITGYTDTYLHDCSAILVGDQGSWTQSVRYVENSKFYPGNHTQVIKITAPDVCQKYIYYVLKFTDLSQFSRGSSLIPEMNQKTFYQHRLAVPPLELQQQIAATLDDIFANGMLVETARICPQTMELMLAQPTGEDLRDIVDVLRAGSESKENAARTRRAMQNYVKWIRRGYPGQLLGNLCFNKKFPTHPTNYGKTEGSHIFFTGGKNIKFYTDNPDIHEPITIINKVNGMGKCNIIYSSQPCSVADQAFIVHSDDAKINKYIFHILQGSIEILEDGYKGSLQKCLSLSYLKDIQIPIPPADKLAEHLEHLEYLDNTARALEEMANRMDRHARFAFECFMAQ